VIPLMKKKVSRASVLAEGLQRDVYLSFSRERGESEIRKNLPKSLTFFEGSRGSKRRGRGSTKRRPRGRHLSRER